MNIPEVWLRFKSSLSRVPEEAILIAIIVLVGFSAFGLGRLSALESSKEPVRILSPEGEDVARSANSADPQGSSIKYRSTQTASVKSAKEKIEKNIGSSGEVVASKNSNKYHLPWCGGAKRISEANKIIFASKTEAEKAGYTPAANCPGI